MSVTPPEALPNLDFAAWEKNLADTVDKLTKLIDGIDANPLARFVFKTAGVLAAVDQAKALLDVLDGALHKLP